MASFDTLKNAFNEESKLSRDHFVEEGQLWLLANGMFFEKGEVFKADAKIPVLFSNDSIPSEVSLGLKKIENGLAQVFYLQTFERDDIKDFIVDEASFFSGFNLEKLGWLSSFDFFMEYESNLKISTQSKICEEFTHGRVIKTDEFKNVTRTRGVIKEIR